MHVVGVSGTGKSYFLEHMIRQDIENGAGVCVIDPHGELYQNLVNWLSEQEIERFRTIHLINPSDTNWSLAFNPLAAGDSDPTVRVGAMVNACIKVWGNEGLEKTPRLAKCLRLVFYALAANKLSIAEAKTFTSIDNKHKEARSRLVNQLPDLAMREEWRSLLALGDREYAAQFESTDSRLIPFATAPIVRTMMGQTEHVIDFRKCMEENAIVLVNLANRDVFEEESARVLGSMILSDLFFSAKRRDFAEAKENPFYCYVDECPRFLTADVIRALDETRKFGLHYVLAHQRLQQLRDLGDDMYDAVMAGAQSKVVFKVDEDDTAETLARLLYRKELDLQEPKEIMNKPIVVGQVPVWMHSESTTESESLSESTSVNEAESSSSSYDDEGVEVGSSEAANSSTSSTSSYSHSSSQTRGRSQAFQNIYEDRPTQLFTIEEQIHKGIVAIRSLPKRTAIAYLADSGKPFRFSTTDIDTYEAPEVLLKDFVEEVNKENPTATLSIDARRNIDLRFQQVVDNIELFESDSDDDFFDA